MSDVVLSTSLESRSHPKKPAQKHTFDTAGISILSPPTNERCPFIDSGPAAKLRRPRGTKDALRRALAETVEKSSALGGSWGLKKEDFPEQQITTLVDMAP